MILFNLLGGGTLIVSRLHTEKKYIIMQISYNRYVCAADTYCKNTIFPLIIWLHSVRTGGGVHDEEQRGFKGGLKEDGPLHESPAAPGEPTSEIPN